MRYDFGVRKVAVWIALLSLPFLGVGGYWLYAKCLGLY